MENLIMPKMATLTDITLNIGLGGSSAYRKYKRPNAEHIACPDLLEAIKRPYKIVAILDHVKSVLCLKDDSVLKYSISQSESEATLVVHITNVDLWSVDRYVSTLSDVLEQDCIALWVHNDTSEGGYGKLLGRYNYVWGEFNPDYFIHSNTGC